MTTWRNYVRCLSPSKFITKVFTHFQQDCNHSKWWAKVFIIKIHLMHLLLSSSSLFVQFWSTRELQMNRNPWSVVLYYNWQCLIFFRLKFGIRFMYCPILNECSILHLYFQNKNIMQFLFHISKIWIYCTIWVGR